MATPLATPFIPKQALKFDGALLQELQGDVSDTIVRDLLREDLPPLTASSVIHDNGCGYGAVTMAIMDSNPPDGIQIHATDVNPMFTAQLQAKLTANPSWPVKLETMDARNLTFPDNTFDLSLTTFVFAGLKNDEAGNDVAAASHILRTLKPGGTGLIAVWKEMPWHVALENAHRKTRGADVPMAPFLSTSWYKKEKVIQVTNDAGWKDVNFVEKTAWLNLGPDLKRWATIAWTFLAGPVGGWQQRDEDKWEEAIDSIAEELSRSEWHKVENGVHKIRMVADVAIAQK
ncbi:S-adenosyl-L-methionine-dependent methyltransferase [Hypoxylon rubiginosum]|uniref:S-adenosyl-L-methionine-dependent methyltransferase n=1 Tax=Hypoxylon rubiginosum TaxID=110542 RepID=A0ACC0CU29_9PEZI|nr:S-adenosyl-L-methionine-dependent methyltransferase [Hypoxylon rubiginosum]